MENTSAPRRTTSLAVRNCIQIVDFNGDTINKQRIKQKNLEQNSGSTPRAKNAQESA